MFTVIFTSLTSFSFTSLCVSLWFILMRLLLMLDMMFSSHTLVFIVYTYIMWHTVNLDCLRYNLSHSFIHPVILSLCHCCCHSQSSLCGFKFWVSVAFTTCLSALPWSLGHSWFPFHASDTVIRSSIYFPLQSVPLCCILLLVPLFSHNYVCVPLFSSPLSSPYCVPLCDFHFVTCLFSPWPDKRHVAESLD